MRNSVVVLIALGLTLAPVTGFAENVGITLSNGVQIECNWGTLTSVSIANGFPQGSHSRDPSGDGHGPGSVDEPRAGLANMVALGDLQATCELIRSLLTSSGLEDE